MSASGSIILAMTLSGGLAGLGGSVEVLGTVPQMSNDISAGFGFNAIALALLAGNRPSGIVAAALLFGALRTGGGLMQVKTGIPLDLLVFIQALVIMFVAASGLIRALWRIGTGQREYDTPAEEGAAGMTAATPTFEQVTPETSAAERKALRSARIRGAVFVVFGLYAFYAAVGTFATTATFSFWISEQGGEQLTISTTVGILWILAGLVAGLIGMAQLVRGARFPWRRTLLFVIPIWVITIMANLLDGKAANLTNVFTGSLEYAVPVSLGAFAGILSERSGMLNIAIEGKFLVGALRRPRCVVVGHGRASWSASRPRPVAAALVGLLLAWLGIRWKVDQIITGVVINIGAVGITNFLFLRVLTKHTELNTPNRPSSRSASRSCRRSPCSGRSCSTGRPTCTSR